MTCMSWASVATDFLGAWLMMGNLKSQLYLLYIVSTQCIETGDYDDDNEDDYDCYDGCSSSSYYYYTFA